MMRIRTLTLLLAGLGLAAPLSAQTFTTDDPILNKIWEEGMEQSQAAPLAQALLDSIGPRLTGSPGHEAGNQWLIDTYRSWGIEAEAEPYGEWMRWRRGVTHIDLLAPRVRSLEGTLLAWSHGTDGRKEEAEVVIIPDVADSNAFAQWLPSVRGKFVAVSRPESTCRPDANWEADAADGSFDRMRAARSAAREAWSARIARTGVDDRALPRHLEDAGAIGVVGARWASGWGVDRIFSASTERVPHIQLSCEDYGLVFRLADAGQGPMLSVSADAEFLGVGPVSNVIAVIPGSEKPDEFVMLSAHFDSWDGASGATDNGTGTITMLEAARILKTVYPSPKRTIIVGHWGGEEQGLNGSRAYAAAHPEVVEDMQALFNQDNGTGRVVRLSSQGLVDASGTLARWLSRVPSEITQHITFSFPGMASGGGTDHAAFVCAGAPAFVLGAHNWEYFRYTWHTNRDTYDKIVWDDLLNNATLTAMLAYLAAEEPEFTSRERRTVFPARNGRKSAGRSVVIKGRGRRIALGRWGSRGNPVRVLASGMKPAGTYEVLFDVAFSHHAPKL